MNKAHAISAYPNPPSQLSASQRPGRGRIAHGGSGSGFMAPS
jgi:hypothetical protein